MLKAKLSHNSRTKMLKIKRRTSFLENYPRNNCALKCQLLGEDGFLQKLRVTRKKIDSFTVFARNVITYCKPQTLTCDISGTESPICMKFLPTCSSTGAL